MDVSQYSTSETPEARLLAFLRLALDRFEFDHLFLCDDATYVAVDRLHSLVSVGHECPETSGGPDACAGTMPDTCVLLFRAQVEHLVSNASLADGIDRDLLVIVGAYDEGVGHGAVRRTMPSVPRVRCVAMHCPTPDQMRVAHTLATEEPEGKVRLEHPDCQGEIHFYADGSFARHPEPEYGLWNIDGEANLDLRFFGPKGPLRVPVGPLFGGENGPRKRIGILVVATGRYRSFVHDLVRSVRRFFLPNHERTVFLFTDAEQVFDPDVQVLRVKHSAWPGMTLMRYALFRDHAEAFAGHGRFLYRH